MNWKGLAGGGGGRDSINITRRLYSFVWVIPPASGLHVFKFRDALFNLHRSCEEEEEV